MNELISGIVLFEKTADGAAEACNTALIKRSQSIPSPLRTDFGKIKNHEVATFDYLFNILSRKRLSGLTPC